MTSGEGVERIRTIAVTASDVVTAAEAGHRGGDDEGRTVLRITPPFSGRMRARIHQARPDEYADADPPHPVHVPPADLLGPAAPAYPTPSDTEDELRADPDAEYTPERHRERHVAAVEAWREQARAAIADTVTLRTPARDHEVSVAVLG